MSTLFPILTHPQGHVQSPPFFSRPTNTLFRFRSTPFHHCPPDSAPPLFSPPLFIYSVPFLFVERGDSYTVPAHPSLPPHSIFAAHLQYPFSSPTCSLKTRPLKLVESGDTCTPVRVLAGPACQVHKKELRLVKCIL